MRTDKQVYLIFETEPQWVFELAGLDSPGPCAFRSVTCKAIERRLDGLLVPESIAAACWIVEFQTYFDAMIYNRVAVEMSLVQEENSGRDIQGMIIFLSPELDPITEPWNRIIHSFYLPRILEDLARRSPNHPLVALLQPVVEENLAVLEKRAAAYYNQIKTSALPEPSKATLLEVFVNWLEQRFKDRGKMEIENMLLGEMPDLRDTQSGKDLIAIGVREGMEKGIEQGELIGQITLLEKLLRLPVSNRQQLASRNVDELRKQLDDLQSKLPSI